MKKNEYEELLCKYQKSIAKEVKNARLKKGQTIEEFSKNCKISRDTLIYIENAKGDIDLYLISCICKYLDIEFKDFFKNVENRIKTL